MRASTLLFLGMIAAVFLMGRARHRGACPLAAVACESQRVPEPPRDAARTARVRALEREHDGLERRGRELDRALQAVAQSIRTLQSLADQDGAGAVRQELAAVGSGETRLKELRRAVETDKALTMARLQLARAGVDEELGLAPVERLAAETAPEGPLDALERATKPLPAKVTSRAR